MESTGRLNRAQRGVLAGLAVFICLLFLDSQLVLVRETYQPAWERAPGLFGQTLAQRRLDSIGEERQEGIWQLEIKRVFRRTPWLAPRLYPIYHRLIAFGPLAVLLGGFLVLALKRKGPGISRVLKMCEPPAGSENLEGSVHSSFKPGRGVLLLKSLGGGVAGLGLMFTGMFVLLLAVGLLYRAFSTGSSRSDHGAFAEIFYWTAGSLGALLVGLLILARTGQPPARALRDLCRSLLDSFLDREEKRPRK